MTALGEPAFEAVAARLGALAGDARRGAAQVLLALGHPRSLASAREELGDAATLRFPLASALSSLCELAELNVECGFPSEVSDRPGLGRAMDGLP